MIKPSKLRVIERPEELLRSSTRRDFLRLLGAGGSIVLLPSVFAACHSNEENVVITTPLTPTSNTLTLNLANDTGILNYAYLLEQIEAAFYTGVVASLTFGTLTSDEQEVVLDLRGHEVVHREFFKALLGTNAIPSLNIRSSMFASLMGDRDTMLRSAEGFEDLGVAAYNGAGKYLTSAVFLAAVGKIVSVEARHAAAIRDIRDELGIRGGDAQGTRFAGDTVVLPNGLDVKLEPSTVLSRVADTEILTDTVVIGASPVTRAGTNDFGPPSPTP